MKRWPLITTDDEVIDAIRSVPTHYATSYFKIDLADLFQNWNDDVGAWSLTSGGAATAAHPTQAGTITAVFDVNSGDCTVNVASGCTALTTTAYAGTITFAAALTVTNGVTLTNGTISTAGNALQCTVFSSNNGNTRVLNITNSTVTVTSTGTVWNLATTTGLTFTSTGSTIVISNVGASAKTFAGGGLAYGALTITGSSGAVTFTGNNSWAGTFTSGATPLVFTGTTQTFSGSVVLTGCTSITGGTLSKASGTVTAPSGCTLTSSTASGGATFDATAATDGGGNSGWTFGGLLRPSQLTGLGSNPLE